MREVVVDYREWKSNNPDVVHITTKGSDIIECIKTALRMRPDRVIINLNKNKKN